ncbi:hypothetical protein G6F70_002530 [Rhizopus microsporus]|uniref:Endonuclease/exonuclease/phosphatase domain-containing protein n=2 Tax=Rhizopus TaxID=4842 RepID=A0A367KG26_RHIAZ|nr:hypothetical protein G6F71_003935 [Rhizopus microsporus]RCI01129.1 hypothetical protein CU097_015735 [Rhizopus azygosporus]KAG1202132.1 hypothetical protein G6F70_002530 [Rhizopus microsporus]KAG1215935.1 hypothetical protein G6F69_000569 [Rhizopus microsporus]KAG1237293.1 hypothetical protein G6F67_001323 [Rhizopus microsporus]
MTTNINTTNYNFAHTSHLPTNSSNPSSSNSNHNFKTGTLRIASLNCRSLIKQSQPQLRQEFIRFLRSQSSDILTVQESHASTPNSIATLELLLRTSSATWSRHCGIISFNPAITITPLYIIIDQRLIACKAEH